MQSANGQGMKVGWGVDYWTWVKPILLRCFDDGAFMKALDDVVLRVVHRLIAKAKSHALKDLRAWLLWRGPLMGLR